MACGILKPRYCPALENERPVETEEGAGDAVDAVEEASLLSPLGIAALTLLIAPPEAGDGDIDVDAMVAAAAPPTGDTLAPATIGVDDVAPTPASGGAGGAAPPPAA